ncbi:AAA-domain-containing protein [Ramicandelaber brevisporus]|nr:AAA-domain-containing protein [Ramicandelaber brevisporus]
MRSAPVQSKVSLSSDFERKLAAMAKFLYQGCWSDEYAGNLLVPASSSNLAQPAPNQRLPHSTASATLRVKIPELSAIEQVRAHNRYNDQKDKPVLFRDVDVTQLLEDAQRVGLIQQQHKRVTTEKSARNVVSHLKGLMIASAQSNANKRPRMDNDDDGGDNDADADDGEDGEGPDGTDSEDSSFEDLDGVKMMTVPPTRAMNNLAMSTWGARPKAAAATTSAATPSASKKPTTVTGQSSPVHTAESPSATPVPATADAAASNKPVETTPNVSAERAPKRARKGGRTGTEADLADKYRPPTTRLSDLAGIDKHILEATSDIYLPIMYPWMYGLTPASQSDDASSSATATSGGSAATGYMPPTNRGFLIHGPKGSGKTTFAHAIAGQFGLNFLLVKSPEYMSAMTGESEKKLRELFENAKRVAPSLIFIDEVDILAPRSESSSGGGGGGGVQGRLTVQLKGLMESLHSSSDMVFVMAATNRTEQVSPLVMGTGSFGKLIGLGVPDQEAREKILRCQCGIRQNVSEIERPNWLGDDICFTELAQRTPGYVGGDLVAVVGEAIKMARMRFIDEKVKAAAHAENNDMDIDQPPTSSSSNTLKMTSVARKAQEESMTKQQLQTLESFMKFYPPTSFGDDNARSSLVMKVFQADFVAAIKKVTPNAKREGFATVPDVTWNDIGAMSVVLADIKRTIAEPIDRPGLFAYFGIDSASGALLWGPPGCGKTLVAKAVANFSKSNFISVKGPELLNKYVGESESAVRQVFARAAQSQPCIIFFDELDALCPVRDSKDNRVTSNVVNTFLTELDGLTSRGSVYVIGATNRPDMIDPALLRSGRFEHRIYVGMPNASDRADILRKCSAKIPLANDVDLVKIASDHRCDGFSGADLKKLTDDAARAAAMEFIERETGDEADLKKSFVTASHFEQALSIMKPSVSKKALADYEALRKKFENEKSS